MKLHLFLYLMGIIKDFKNVMNNSKVLNNTKYSKFLQYNSDLVGKIELSAEMLFEILDNNNQNYELIFERKKNLILILELIRLCFKFNELKSLSETGFNFYCSKKIYFDQVLNMSDEEYYSKLGEVK